MSKKIMKWRPLKRKLNTRPIADKWFDACAIMSMEAYSAMNMYEEFQRIWWGLSFDDRQFLYADAKRKEPLDKKPRRR